MSLKRHKLDLILKKKKIIGTAIFQAAETDGAAHKTSFPLISEKMTAHVKRHIGVFSQVELAGLGGVNYGCVFR